MAKRLSAPGSPDALRDHLREHYIGLSTIVLKRVARPPVTVAQWELEPTPGQDPHDAEPMDSLDDLVATVAEAGERHAASYGTGEYRLSTQRARGSRGSAPAPRTVDFVLAAAAAADHTAAARDITLDLAKYLFGEIRSMMAAQVELVKSLGPIMGSLADAHRQLAADRQSIASDRWEHRAVELEAAESAARRALAEKVLLPIVPLVKSEVARLRGVHEPPAAAAEAQAGNDPLVAQVEAFRRSLTAEQRASLPSGMLAQLEGVTTRADVLRFGGDVIERVGELGSLIASLSPAQEAAFAKLHEAIVAAAVG